MFERLKKWLDGDYKRHATEGMRWFFRPQEDRDILRRSCTSKLNEKQLFDAGYALGWADAAGWKVDREYFMKTGRFKENPR